MQIPGSAVSGIGPRPGAGTEAAAVSGRAASATPGLAFASVLLFAIFDYGRPQDVIPGIGAIRPLLLLTLVALIYASSLSHDFVHDDGWLIQVKPSNPDELDDLTDSDSYEAEIAED